jgi:type IX secretion system PorP/SprF family membrane protein
MKKQLHPLTLRLSLYLLLLLPLSAQGQVVPRYATYLINGTLYNPAYTGYREHVYANTLYHRQWLSQGSTPGFLAMLVEGSMSDYVNLGFQLTSEQLGAASLTSLSATYAYRIHLSRTSDLSFGLSLGAMYGGADQSSLQTVAPEDPAVQALAGKAIPHMGAGLYYGSELFYGGVALRNLSGKKKDDLSSDYLLAPPLQNIALTLGTFIPINENVTFRPSLMWQDDFEFASSMDFTLACIFLDRLWLGLSFHTDQPFGRSTLADHSVAILTEAFITDRITVSYAYDLGLDTFNKAYMGGHQISVGYYLTQHKNTPYNYRYRFKSHYKSNICPSCIKR